MQINTFTGHRVNLDSFSEADVRPEDIAHHLALVNRFGGATPNPISVAQHSVYVSMLSPAAPLQGLLHDASEAYLGDVTKWLKESESMRGYRTLEDHVQAVILKKYDLPAELHPEVLQADKLMVRYEAWKSRLTIGVPGYGHPTPEERLRLADWYPWPWRLAERRFTSRLNQLLRGV